MRCFRLAALGVALGVMPAAALAQDLSGTWTGSTGSLNLKQSGTALSGSAVMDGERGVVSATVSRGQLKGSLSVDGDREPFVGTVSGNTLRLVFDGDEGAKAAAPSAGERGAGGWSSAARPWSRFAQRGAFARSMALSLAG